MEEKIENLLIHKNFNSRLIKKTNLLENLQDLSEGIKKLYMTKSDNVEDLRFAQAELYYQLSDFEAAIFKWENVRRNDLIGWAMKNIGDAYYQLNDFQKAEYAYINIVKPSPILKMESLLSLYSLYKEQQKLDKASKIVHEMIATDWTYEDVYQIAITFYEEVSDYESAFALVMDNLEAGYREELLQKIEFYFQNSKQVIQPSFITSRLLKVLWNEDIVKLKRMFTFLNDYYLKTDSFILWLDNLYAAIKDMDNLGEFLLSEAPDGFYKNIEELFSGKYQPYEIKHIIHTHLHDYYLISLDRPIKGAIHSLLIAWEQFFPNSFSITNTESTSDEKVYKLKDIQTFYLNITNWMKRLEFDINEYSSWWTAYYLNNSSKKLMVSGSFSNGKSSFINSIIGEEILNVDHLPTTSTVTILEDSDVEQVLEINKDTIQNIGIEQITNKTTIDHSQLGKLSNELIHISTSLRTLREKRITLIDTPGFNDQQNEHNPTFHFLDLADEMLFILSAETPFKKTEKEAIQKIIDKKPNINISFLLNKIDFLDEDELDETLEDTQRKLNKAFQREMQLIPYSSSVKSLNNLEELSRFFNRTDHLNIEQERIKNALPYLEQLLDNFQIQMQSKVQMHNHFILLRKKEVENIQSLEKRYNIYKSSVLSDISSRYIKLNSNFYEYVKKQIHEKLIGYVDRVNQNSDLNQFHSTLEKEISEQLNLELKKEYLPKIQQVFSYWLLDLRKNSSSIENEIDSVLKELEDIKNLAGNSTPKLDIEKYWEHLMEYFQEYIKSIDSIQVTPFMKFDPIQTILYGIGVLIGSLYNSSTLKLQRYRNYLETKLLPDIADEFVFELMKKIREFEYTIKAEFEDLFHEIENYIQTNNQESKKQMIYHAENLKYLYENKESFNETNKLFKVKLGQLKIDFQGTERQFPLPGFEHSSTVDD